MPDLTLRFPVTTLDARELLPQGTVVSDDVLRELARSSRGASHPELPFLENDTIRKDLFAYMRQDVYRQIFGEEKECGPLLSFMEQILVPMPVFDILFHFRRNEGYTYRHILIVSALTCLFGLSLAQSFRDVLLEASAGPLHDLGKISVPLDILRISRPLRRTERSHLEHHALAGFVLLGYYLGDPGKFPCVVARDHHERKDGSGYPRGIRLADRLVEIVVACDVYDALISPRPYRKRSYDNRTAIEEITKMAEERKIGWDIVQFLVSRNRKERPPREECAVSEEKRGKPPEGNLYGIVIDDDAPV
jgi:HD-GYP domain-containing protein (c-di-GMP phosphodiesterase class II)